MSADQWTEPEVPVEETEVEPVAEEPQIAGTPAGDESPAEDSPVEETPEVTITPLADVEIEYPLVVSVANHEDIVFEDADASVDVPPEVAEQVRYLPAFNEEAAALAAADSEEEVA